MALALSTSIESQCCFLEDNSRKWALLRENGLLVVGWLLVGCWLVVVGCCWLCVVADGEPVGGSAADRVPAARTRSAVVSQRCWPRMVPRQRADVGLLVDDGHFPRPVDPPDRVHRQPRAVFKILGKAAAAAPLVVPVTMQLQFQQSFVVIHCHHDVLVEEHDECHF